MKISTGSKVLVLLAVAIALLIGLESLFLKYLPSLYGSLRADIREAFHRPYFDIGDIPVTPVFLVKSFLFFLLLGLLSRAMRRVLQNKVLVRTALDEGHRYSLGQITGYVVFLSGSLVGLQWVGLNLSSLMLLGGAVGIGVGFGLQNIANNFVSGIILLAFKENGIEIPFPQRDLHLKTVSSPIRIAPDGE